MLIIAPVGQVQFLLEVVEEVEIHPDKVEQVVEELLFLTVFLILIFLLQGLERVVEEVLIMNQELVVVLQEIGKVFLVD